MNPELQIKIDRIKELLAKTTPGPWETDSDRPIGYHILAQVGYPMDYVAWACPMPGAVGIEQRRANQEYIAAVNPVVMQEIIAELERTRKFPSPKPDQELATVKLNICPNCGNTVFMIQCNGGGYAAYCQMCALRGPVLGTIDNAAKEWNALPNVDEMAKAVQQLEEMTKQRDYLANALDTICKKVKCMDCPLNYVNGLCDRRFSCWKDRAEIAVNEQGDVDLPQ